MISSNSQWPFIGGSANVLFEQWRMALRVLIMGNCIMSEDYPHDFEHPSRLFVGCMSLE